MGWYFELPREFSSFALGLFAFLFDFKRMPYRRQTPIDDYQCH
jgi:hypothetical protein